MEEVSIAGNATVIIDSVVLMNLADGDFATLRFPNDLAVLKTGKNRNTLVAVNYTGLQCELELRILRGSNDDILLNQRLHRTEKYHSWRFCTYSWTSHSEHWEV